MNKEDNIVRNCPKCNVILYCSSISARNFANRKNTVCWSCCNILKRDITVSDSTKQKISDKAKKRWATKEFRENVLNNGKLDNFRYYWRGTNGPAKNKKWTEQSKFNVSGDKSHKFGVILTEEQKLVLSLQQKNRYSKIEERKKTSKQIKEAMHRPEVREKHIKALLSSKWIKVKTDKGQIDLIKKWNLLGFNFEINYQVHTEDFLCYIDGYDKEKNVVLEYDSKYHKRQKEKDLIRQNKIINILKPNKFWRYDAFKKQFRNVLESEK